MKIFRKTLLPGSEDIQHVNSHFLPSAFSYFMICLFGKGSTSNEKWATVLRIYFEFS